MAVVKILTRHSPSYKSLIKYILNEDKIDKKTVFTHNLREKDIDGYTREFTENESFRQRHRSDQVYLSHEIISFHRDEENITPEMLNDMVKQYISLRGNEGVYLGAVHCDTDHVHIHLAVSALEYRTGKSFHVAKPELHQLKSEFQRYHKEKYPEISKSFPEHGKGKVYLTDRAWQKAHRVERDQLKIEISQKVRECLDKSQNRTEFLNMLRDANIHHYERSGRLEGIMTADGTKFRFSRLGFAEKISALPILEETQKLKQSNEQIPKTMITKDKNEKSLDEGYRAYLEWQLKTNEQIYNAVTDRKNEMFLEIQNSEFLKANLDQLKEMEALDKKEQDLQSERENLETEHYALSIESDEKEIEELSHIREGEIAPVPEIENLVQEPESDYDSLDDFDLEQDEREDVEETELDELDDIRDSNEDDRDMDDDDMDLGDEP
jgi:hypothetical protein